MTPRARGGPERGSGGISLGWVIAFPAVLLLVIGGIQFAMARYGSSLLQAAAQAGARAAAIAPASASRGQHAAEGFLRDKAGDMLTGTTVTVSLTGSVVSVTVAGTPKTLIPGMTGELIRTASDHLQPEITP